jgi:hypothetical protein
MHKQTYFLLTEIFTEKRVFIIVLAHGKISHIVMIFSVIFKLEGVGLHHMLWKFWIFDNLFKIKIILGYRVYINIIRFIYFQNFLKT